MHIMPLDTSAIYGTNTAVMRHANANERGVWSSDWRYIFIKYIGLIFLLKFFAEIWKMATWRLYDLN